MNRQRLMCMVGAWTLSFLLTACGVESGSDLAGQKPTNPLMVVMGGNTTCADQKGRRGMTPLRSSIAQRFLQLREELKNERGVDADYLISCYSSTEDMAFVANVDDGNITEGRIADFTARTQELANRDGDVILVGHSYGGWLTMKTALALADTNFMAAVMTVDPISRVHCSFSNPGGCLSAPKDISVEQKERINAESDHWGNFYQTQTFYLHSSAINEADENLKIAASHTQIDNHDRVWERVADQVRALF